MQYKCIPPFIKLIALISADVIVTCENPEAQIAGSVTVSGYTDPAVEETTVTFHCPPGLVLDGTNSSMCMENGEWEPALFEISCLGTIQCVLHA